MRGQAGKYRIIAPSRFGYLGSTIPDDSSPSAQARAYLELLDSLSIEQVYVLGTSAGGTIAIRFALAYPERTKGLVLYSSASPWPEEPKKYSKHEGPPAFFCKDYPMWLLRPLLRPLMGMSKDTVYTMLPLGKRKQGMQIDAKIVNPGMAGNFAEYPIEELQVPSLIIAAKDDNLADSRSMEQVLSRFPNATWLPFEDGGHLMVGHEKEIENARDNFVRDNP
ncbi:pimeloyl-ACP methyl ester carboxylesterase [Fontibacillus phaseoli]|uniref:Pimeloyl-ACP methyl ester carboxylesterase n=2 Tax=Fontibacillus phaseoli TaxID=1416533 RepID=A0A369AXX1_9BACL|nr:pimeloyl-ACP methyl ester carboxylesterase [Fontibacillus phaseoli]